MCRFKYNALLTGKLGAQRVIFPCAAICVRPATAEDAEQLLEIYTPFVISEDSSLSNVSFELEAPDVEEFRQRIHDISAQFPYLVGEVQGQILGYVYCHPYRERLA